MTVSNGTSMDVTNRGSASVHQSRDTKTSRARQFCFSLSLKIGTAAYLKYSGWKASVINL